MNLSEIADKIEKIDTKLKELLAERDKLIDKLTHECIVDGIIEYKFEVVHYQSEDPVVKITKTRLHPSESYISNIHIPLKVFLETAKKFEELIE